MKSFFITATGTGIGKTFVTALLIRQLRAQGKSVRALKPLLTGYTDEMARESDTGILLDALGLPINAENIARVTPWRFTAPLAPTMAARREGRTIDPAEVVNFCRAAQQGAEDFLLIEGVGGVMAPLDDQVTVRDWMVALGIPALLVTGSYLGAISHTLTAIEALHSRNIAIAAIVISESPASTVPLDEAAATIRDFAQNIPVQILPRQNGLGAAPDLAYLLTTPV